MIVFLFYDQQSRGSDVVANSTNASLPKDFVTLKLGVRLKTLQLTLCKNVGIKEKGEEDESVSTLCQFSAEHMCLVMTGFANEAMTLKFDLGDVNLVDRREESKSGINKIIRRSYHCKD